MAAMPHAPLVSVVLPARDGGALLAPAVSSVLGQTERDLELLLVDDGTTDGSVAALDRSDPRLRVIPSPGRGVVDALNAGLLAARGRFIARMDADDLSYPDRLATQLAYLADRPDIACAGCGVAVGREDGPADEGFRRLAEWMNALREPADIARELSVECPIAHPSALFRREALEALAGYRDLPWPEDYDLFLRADRLGMRLGKPPGIHFLWRDRPGRVTRTDPRCAPARILALKAHHLARSGRLGTTAAGGEREEARGFHPRTPAGVTDPRPCVPFPPAVTAGGKAGGRPGQSVSLQRGARGVELPGLSPSPTAVAVWGAGPTGKAFARALAAEGVRVAAFLDPHPGRVGREILGAPVLVREEAARFRGAMKILVAVGSRGARPEIRALAGGRGLAEGADYLFVS